jgi:hypothetical protein
MYVCMYVACMCKAQLCGTVTPVRLHVCMYACMQVYSIKLSDIIHTQIQKPLYCPIIFHTQIRKLVIIMRNLIKIHVFHVYMHTYIHTHIPAYLHIQTHVSYH